MSLLCSLGSSHHRASRSMPYFSASPCRTLPWYSVWELAHGTRAPSFTLRSSFGTTSSGSISSRLPRPSHREQAPCGLLNENVLGCISAMDAPQLVHVKFSEKSIDSPAPSLSTVSTSTSPSPTTSRSTTTSTSCL